MLRRKTLIIGYPGEEGDDNYCLQGVNADINNYTNHLYSIHGGAWELSEIDNDNINISYLQLQTKLNSFYNVDYSIVIFSGHGRYNNQLDETEIQLNKNTFVPVSKLNTGCERQLIICDCCREKTDVILQESFIKSMCFDSQSFVLNREIYRTMFDRQLQQSSLGKIKVFSCSVGECAQDCGTAGGMFSHYLLKSASGNSNLTVAQTFNQAYDLVVDKSDDKQHPQMMRARSGNTFPFYLA